MNIKKCLLVILDGFGISLEKENNAIYLANTPYLDFLFKNYPNTTLKCSGEDVGLPKGFMGNSEVGHLNIGAGRVVYQDLLRINRAIDDKSFFKIKALTLLFDNLKKSKKKLHIMGLLSDGGVHSHIDHFFAILQFAKEQNFFDICLHPILDGRDTSPLSGINYLKQLENVISKNRTGRVGSLCGRFYAMDRDKRWDRIKKAYDLFTNGKCEYKENNSTTALKNAYDRGETDEFISPTYINGDNKIEDGDSVIFLNFRADRAREITDALTDSSFENFNREKIPNISYVCMTDYGNKVQLPLLFPPVKIKKTLGETISNLTLKQLRIAETEKYAHVTYFFNGGREEPFKNEDRVLIPSLKDIKTYDLKPEMCAEKITEEFIKNNEKKEYSLIVLNFANPDMVGHTGNLEATIKAIETVDSSLKKTVQYFQNDKNSVIVISDHGNAEKMFDKDSKEKHTAHTLNDVPFIMISNDIENKKIKKGALKDVAPTILDILDIEKPVEMTGESLLRL